MRGRGWVVAFVRVDRLGNLWVRAMPEGPTPGPDEVLGWGTAPDGPARFTVFDREGRLLGDVETPQGLTIFDVGDDYVLGVTRDDLDIEQIRLHRLIKD